MKKSAPAFDYQSAKPLCFNAEYKQRRKWKPLNALFTVILQVLFHVQSDSEILGILWS